MKYSAFIDVEGLNASHLAFLAKAVSDDSTRFFMNYIHIEPSEKGEGLLGISTDGRRIHLVDPIPEPITRLGLTPGYWKAFKTNPRRVWLARLEDKETDGWNFPNWRKIIPTEKAVHVTTFEGFALAKNHRNSRGMAEFFSRKPHGGHYANATMIQRRVASFKYFKEEEKQWKQAVTHLQRRLTKVIKAA